MSQVAVVVKVHAAPGQRDQLIAALQVALQTVEGEPGTLRYILHEDAADADVVWFYEMYTDQDALVLHSSTDAFKAMSAAMKPFVAGRPELTFLKPIGGKGI